jgi:hypothetical protein
MVKYQKLLILLLISACAVLLLPDASRAVMRKVELPEMVSRAGTIVHGIVLSNESREEENGAIYTYTTVSVIEELTGRSSEETVVVRNMGGTVGSKGLRVTDVPTFEPGEEVILFLEPEPRVEETDLVGWEQGAFRAVDGIVQRNQEPVETFKSEIRSLLAGLEAD